MAEQSIEFRYDTQLLIEGTNLDEDAISEYFEKISLVIAYLQSVMMN